LYNCNYKYDRSLVNAGANEEVGKHLNLEHFLEFGHEVTHPISRTYNVRVEGITSITKYSAGTTVIVKIEVQDNKQDALAFFYHKRSGIPIEMPYAGGEQWTRPAGHIGVAPNKGDTMFLHGLRMMNMQEDLKNIIQRCNR